MVFIKLVVQDFSIFFRGFLLKEFKLISPIMQLNITKNLELELNLCKKKIILELLINYELRHIYKTFKSIYAMTTIIYCLGDFAVSSPSSF